MTDKNAYAHSSKKQDYGTPQFIFDALNLEFPFTIDVCANAENAKCKRFYTEEDNSLSKDWSKEICFMNPPYNMVDVFMRKAFHESSNGAIVVCLVPARIDSKWWHKYVMKTEWRMFTQRIEYVGGNNRAPMPSAIVIFRPKESKVGVFTMTRAEARKAKRLGCIIK